MANIIQEPWKTEALVASKLGKARAKSFKERSARTAQTPGSAAPVGETVRVGASTVRRSQVDTVPTAGADLRHGASRSGVR